MPCPIASLVYCAHTLRHLDCVMVGRALGAANVFFLPFFSFGRVAQSKSTALKMECNENWRNEVRSAVDMAKKTTTTSDEY